MNEFIYRVLTHNETLARQWGRAPRYFVHTYGCQMNVRESEILSGRLEQMGYTRALRENEADFILYNTCCVRENAENKIFGNLGYLKYYKQQNPALIIAVCGCMVQQPLIYEQIIEKHRYVDILFGTANHDRFPALLWRHIETGCPSADITLDDATASIVEDYDDDYDENYIDECNINKHGINKHGINKLGINKHDINKHDTNKYDDNKHDTEAPDSVLLARGHTYKAGVTVMYGCNNFCAYCIVPYVRGRERSRRPADILREAKALADDGVKEIMLLGQNVNAYGASASTPTNFAELLRQVNKIDGLERIRFMTSHPKDFSDALIAAIADCDKVCKSVHLPLQSGSTRILQAMNRHYDRETYLSLARRIQSAVPGIALTTDIIVGFPGETEADFVDTLDVIGQVRFAGVFTFLYSKRTGTPAASMPDPVPEAVAAERFKRLTAFINPMLLERNQRRIGTVLTVMAEDVKPGPKATLTGRADDNTLVHFSTGQPVIPGTMVDVIITEAKTFYLTGQAKEPIKTSHALTKEGGMKADA